MVDAVLEDARVNPAAAGGGAVVLHLDEGRQQLALLRSVEVIAVDFLQDLLGIRLAFLVFWVVPGDLLYRKIARIG